MRTYKVNFYTDADYALREFRARSGKDALRRAQAFAEDNSDDLIFERYDVAAPINKIRVHDEDGNEVATWYDDDLRLRLAARDLFSAADWALRDLREFYSDSESETIRVLVEAIAKATGSRS